MSESVAKLENLIGHKFQDLKLLERAVTHRSWAFENLPNQDEAAVRECVNESLEFVGDSVLGLVVAEELFLSHPKLSEGDLTLMKHRLVSTATLAAIAEGLKLGEYVRFGRGEEKTGGRKKAALLANTLEAVIGAVFFDSGYASARFFIKRVFDAQFRSATPKSSLDFKSMLQETLQARRLQAPTYSLIKAEGPPHDRKFFVEAVWDGGSARGEGISIKAAEMMAAEAALVILKAEVSN